MATIKKRGNSYLFRCYAGYATNGRQIEKTMTWTPPEGMSEKKAEKPADPTKTGYTFAGWDAEIPATMPAENVTINATWSAGNVQFTVEHYYQNANDDGYTKVSEDTKYGTTGANVSGIDYKKALDEAIYKSAENAVIAADGSTVIKVYYERTTYTLTFTYGDKTGESVAYTLRYGQNVTYNPSFSVQGYVFVDWDKQIPATMPGENVTLNATWTAGSGVAYSVEHYHQNANNDEYTLIATENRTGVTGTVIDGATIATKIENGIVLKSAESKAIAADGSTVIKIYYDRVNYTVTYTYGDKVGEAVEHTVRYGATLPAAPVFSVVGSERDPGSANNNFNYQFGMWNVIIWPYLNQFIDISTNNMPYIILDSSYNQQNGGAVWIDRVPLEVRSTVDDNNDNNIWKGYARFMCGFNDWRAMAVGGVDGAEAIG